MYYLIPIIEILALSFGLTGKTFQENEQKKSSSEEKIESTTKVLKPGELISSKGLPTIWVQGDPVTQWDQETVYIFEFWATWCAPCMAEMPHLEALHEHIQNKKLKAQIIGVNYADQLTLEQIKTVLKRQKTIPTYTIAIDEREKSNVKKYWLGPLNVNGLPHAIAIKNGQLLWNGHPRQLTNSFIEQMTSPQFKIGTQPEQTPKAEKTQIQEKISHIRSLYLANNWEAAEKEVHSFLNNPQIEETYKIDLLSIPSQIAFDQKNYIKMNAFLRRQVDSLPQSIDNLMHVANYILACDDLALEHRDIALALMCVERAIQQKPQNAHLHAKMAQIYKLREEWDQALKEIKLAVQCSAPAKFHQEINDIIQKQALNQEEKSLKTNVIKQLEESEKNIITKKKTDSKVRYFEPSISTTEESKKLLEFLSQFPMAQGVIPTNIPKNQVLFLDLWEAPPAGPLGPFVADRRPGRWIAPKIKDTSAQMIILSVGNDVEKNKLALKRQQFVTEFPVCVIPWEKICEQFIIPHKMGYRLPLAIAIRDGQIIWFGNPQDIPLWVTENATCADYNHENNIKNQAIIKEKQKIAWAAIRKAQQANSIEEVKKIIEPHIEIIQASPGFEMMYQEIMMGVPYTQKDYQGVGKICVEILNQYPNDNFVAERVFKILTSNINLREKNLMIVYQAVIQMMLTKRDRPGYESACWMIIAEIAKEQNDFILSLFAAQNAAQTTEFASIQKELEQKNLK